MERAPTRPGLVQGRGTYGTPYGTRMEHGMEHLDDQFLVLAPDPQGGVERVPEGGVEPTNLIQYFC